MTRTFQLGPSLLLTGLVTIILVSQLSFTSLAQSIEENFDYGMVIDELRQIHMPRIQEHLSFFSSRGSRVTGYKGFYEAAKYIYEYFYDLGLINVTYLNFTLAMPID